MGSYDKGYIQLAMRTGQYKFINTDMVYEGQIKSRNKLTGEITFNDDDPAPDAKVIGYFAYIELLNGFSKIMYSPVHKIREHAAKYSKSYKPEDKTSIWVTNFDEMALKTVLRYLLSHYGFLSTEMIQAISDELKADSTIDNFQSEVDDKANVDDVSFDDVSDQQQPAQELQQEREEVSFDAGPAKKAEPEVVKKEKSGNDSTGSQATIDGPGF